MHIVKNLIVFIIGIGFALAVAEIILTIFWKPDFLNSNYKRDDLAWIQNNVKLNSFGYRDSEINLKKDVKKLRIYSLGDSFTYGWYINDQNLSYPALAEENLNKENIPVEIINASQPGFKPKDSLERFKNDGLLFSPDIVTLGINIYDIPQSEFAPRYTTYKILRNSRLYQLVFGNLERARIANKTNEEIHKSLQNNSENLLQLDQTIKQFKTYTSSIGAKFVLVVFPNYDPANPNLPYAYNLFHAQMANIAQNNNIDVIDLLSVYSQVADKKELILNPLDDHPTIFAHSLAAKELERYSRNVTTNYKPVVQNFRTRNFKIGDTMPDKSILVAINKQTQNVNNFVTFDLENGSGVQKKVLTDKKYRKLDYMVDYLKTAKSGTHDGWPGAKIEYNILGGELVLIDSKLYGFEVLGVSQITGFWKENGNQKSKDIEPSEVQITRNKNSIVTNIKNGNQFDLYRFHLDIKVTQIEFEDKKLNLLAKSHALSGFIDNKNNSLFFPTKMPISTAKFVSNGKSSDYVWINDSVIYNPVVKTEKGINIQHSTTKDNVEVELGIIQLETNNKENISIEYITY